MFGRSYNGTGKGANVYAIQWATGNPQSGAGEKTGTKNLFMETSL